MSKRKLKIGVIGTGAIGSYYGIMLSQMGHEIHFLLHSSYQEVKENGLLLKSEIHGDILLSSPQIYQSAEDMPICEVVIVALKTIQNETVLTEVLPYVTDDKTTVILIQNGMGMEQDMASLFTELQFAGAAALIGCHKEKNGIIVHEGYGAIDFGSFNLKNTEILHQLSEEFTDFGIPSSVQDLTILRWKKLVWNMTFNGLSVALNSTTDILLEKYEEKCRIIMDEVAKAAGSQGVIIPESFINGLIPFTREMGSYSPSMKLDFENYRPMELEYIYERPIAAAKKSGIEMPQTSLLYHELWLLQKKHIAEKKLQQK
ncbi:2-dehydropantoate 2-reductase [Chryseobacterium sp. JK1]|uniref:2-dehydropantoate 2-reductase n=1 Tax=Chryseobacterium sp. JK1 TaxID=874294 RepID=UPI003D69C8B8